jgi:hypothetical protein
LSSSVSDQSRSPGPGQSTRPDARRPAPRIKGSGAVSDKAVRSRFWLTGSDIGVRRRFRFRAPEPFSASTTLKEGQPDDDSIVGAMARFQREYNGKQPGDPDKAAAAILHIAGLTEPTLRLLLGRDAYDGVEKNDLARIEAARKWDELSYSTDFRQTEGQSTLE